MAGGKDGMVERAFAVPSEVPRLIEFAAELAQKHQRTGSAERRFLQDILVACATAPVGTTACVTDHADMLEVVFTGGGAEPVVVQAPGVLRTDGVDEPSQGTAGFIYDFAQQTVRELAQLRQELEETNDGVVALYSEVHSRRAAEGALRTELEERAQRLLAVDKRKDEFIAMLGHELRNPIATLEGAVETLRALPNVANDAQAIKVLDVLDRHGANVKRMLDDLLNVSRIKRGKVVLSKRETDLSQLVAESGEDAVSRAARAGHTLTVSVPDEPLWMSADPARIEQVITNLLDNAIKYTNAPGHIELRVEQDDEFAIVAVQDDGVGIESNRIRSAFEAFVQLNTTLDRAAGGLGLGLSVVKALAELHGGVVRAHSDGPGCGSTFEVRLPLLPPAQWPDTQPASDMRKPTSGIRKRSELQPVLLLVEDNVDLRELTARRLGRRGFRVVEAGDCTQALAQVQDVTPQVVVTDIGLPGCDGFELARRLDAALGPRSYTRVAVSGYGPPKDAESRELFDAYFVKPLDVEALVALIERRRSAEG